MSSQRKKMKILQNGAFCEQAHIFNKKPAILTDVTTNYLTFFNARILVHFEEKILMLIPAIWVTLCSHNFVAL